MAGMTFDSVRISPNVGPALLLDRRSLILTTAGSGALPDLPHSTMYSVMRLRSVSSSTSRTMSSRPLPVSGLPFQVVSLFFIARASRPFLVPPVPSVMASVVESASATARNSSGVMPAATSAAVIEPTDAPAIFLVSFSTPLSYSAFTAPGSAVPLPPPPEKVISPTLAGGAV
jgi:hypothetical protein